MAPDRSAERLAADRALDYSENSPIAKGDLVGLYTSVGWSNYTRNPDLLHRAVENSLWKLSVWDGREVIGPLIKTATRHEVIGLARAVGDDASIAYIQDILVRPDMQRHGIGARLASAALERFAHVPQIVLITDDEEKTASFYRSAGMTDLGELGVRGFARFSF